MSLINSENIAVLAGGPSCEREISLISGKAVLDAFLLRGYSAFMLDPAEGFIQELRDKKATVAFIALHGQFGEDGTVQRLLEEANISYTGPGPQASEAAFHKSKSQSIFKQANLQVPDFYVLQKKEFSDETMSPLSFPLVVKPSAAGSSVGVAILLNSGDFTKACRDAFLYSDEILVERYIHGRELTVGILEDKPLPVVEVVAQRSFYDYEAKYKDTGTRYECPANLEERVSRQIQELALKAYKALGCEAMSRADFILSESGEVYLLEMNTIPGLTGKSLLPKAAKAAGIDFPDLCVKILELSLKKRHISWSNR